MTGEQSTDVLIVGGGLGGCAAALAIAKAGYRVVMTEQTDWIGGQLTSQAVPPDEHGWIERFGCTASYRKLRNYIRDFYRNNYPLTASARKREFLNPGNGWVSPLCHEPIVALEVLRAMLAPYVSRKLLTIALRHQPVAVELGAGDRISAVTFRNEAIGTDQTIAAKYVLDATELGDLLSLGDIEFSVGRESHTQTDEPDAATESDATDVQSMSVCFAIDHIEGEDHTSEKPSRYDFWREYVPPLKPSWPGKLLDWKACHPRTMETVEYQFNPHHESSRAFSGLWSYRRILARDNFQPGTFASDICAINWPMIDYLPGHLLNDSAEENNRHLADAKQLSLSLLYWLQTEAPRTDGGLGYPGLRLRKDVVGTDDGLAKYPYIRESRRIKAEFTVCQQHVSAKLRPNGNRAQQFEDSVGIGSYRIDLHPTTGGKNYLDVEALPFQIPLGALIPVRIENLLPAAKNLGVTHITGGCYRLHPVEWNVGEVAGLLACYCLKKSQSPRGVYRTAKLRREFQSFLEQQGVQLEWPSDIVLKEGDPHGHAL
ncbi:FAD-dependent oxidoreductase [Adhaeretor mobilis]|uniref:3-ketosteroid-delta-1-dehydrogenase n=1 Tax=Adhaeretor mobilis TaxID=1930276 RepID=A0A517MW21_9BACT|nr:FAD-dependent oxidoreductase [Adhaeretor mobilis]QDS99068.1 3-ketosteroid-delta-1-dehydrogenase [Adhaeretor mobilis]